MVMAGTPQDQELMAEGKDLCLQNEASSEPISQEEEEEGEHGSETGPKSSLQAPSLPTIPSCGTNSWK